MARHYGKIDSGLERLSRQYGLPIIRLADFRPQPDALALAPPGATFEHEFLPIALTGIEVIVAISQAPVQGVLQLVAVLLGRAVAFVLAARRELVDAIAENDPMGA